MLFKKAEKELRIMSNNRPLLKGIFIKENEKKGRYNICTEYGAYCECSEYR